jgi:hypothetical protein
MRLSWAARRILLDSGQHSEPADAASSRLHLSGWRGSNVSWLELPATAAALQAVGGVFVTSLISSVRRAQQYEQSRASAARVFRLANAVLVAGIAVVLTVAGVSA